MPESSSHNRAKRRAAGPGGKTEVKLPGNQRLDAKSAGGKKAVEVERSGNLEAAARRLKKSRAPQKVLQVPQKDMSDAAAAMRKVGVGGTVKNLTGTKRRSVSKP
jgi:hypothetical protein